MGGSVNKLKEVIFDIFNFFGKLIAFLLYLLFVPMTIIFSGMLIIPKIISQPNFFAIFTKINPIIRSLINLAYTGSFIRGFVIYFITSLVVIMTLTWKLKKPLVIHGITLFLLGVFYLIINSFYSFLANKLPPIAVEYLEENLEKVISGFRTVGIIYIISGAVLLIIAAVLNIKTKKEKEQLAEEQKQSTYVKSLTLDPVEETDENLSDEEKTKQLFVDSDVVDEQAPETFEIEEPKSEAIDIPIEITPEVTQVAEISVSKEANKTPEIINQIAEQEPIIEETIQTYCTNCGKTLETDSIFCTNCGTKK